MKSPNRHQELEESERQVPIGSRQIQMGKTWREVLPIKHDHLLKSVVTQEKATVIKNPEKYYSNLPR